MAKPWIYIVGKLIPVLWASSRFWLESVIGRACRGGDTGLGGPKIRARRASRVSCGSGRQALSSDARRTRSQGVKCSVACAQPVKGVSLVAGRKAM